MGAKKVDSWQRPKCFAVMYTLLDVMCNGRFFQIDIYSLPIYVTAAMERMKVYALAMAPQLRRWSCTQSKS